MNIVIIDNYDSFTYNLVHAVEALGCQVTVFRNDQFELAQLAEFDKIILSPGPGIPSEAGLLLEVIGHYAATKPILGVCLGHQAIGEYFGGSLTNLAEVFHGVQTQAEVVEQDYLFEGMGPQIMIGRYHSWVVDHAELPACLAVTMVSEEGQVMALRHNTYDVRGIQFHPESILTPEGIAILRNWVEY